MNAPRFGELCFRYLASAPKVHWQAGAEALAHAHSSTRRLQLLASRLHRVDSGSLRVAHFTSHITRIILNCLHKSRNPPRHLSLALVPRGTAMKTLRKS
jgi:hypothetical protein